MKSAVHERLPAAPRCRVDVRHRFDQLKSGPSSAESISGEYRCIFRPLHRSGPIQRKCRHDRGSARLERVQEKARRRALVFEATREALAKDFEATNRVKIGQSMNLPQRIDAFKFDELLGLPPLVIPPPAASDHPEDHALEMKRHLVDAERQILRLELERVKRSFPAASGLDSCNARTHLKPISWNEDAAHAIQLRDQRALVNSIPQ